MPLVPSPTAAWLQSPELLAEASGPAGWGTSARDSRVGSPLAAQADAQAEAARQAAFLGPAAFRDRVRVEGQRLDLIGRAVPLAIDGGAAVACFVLAAAELDDGGTELTVLRRL